MKLTGKDDDIYFQSLVAEPSLPEADIVALMALSLKPDSYVVDVGANLGYISLVASLLADKGKVFAFEPVEEAFSLLRTNLRLNGVKNVIAKNIGLSDTKRKVTMSHARNNMAGAFVSNKLVQSLDDHKSTQISLDKLDSIYKDVGITKCDLLKVDIEGHELKFLRGAKNFIEKTKPIAVLEANHWCLNVLNRITLPDFIEEVNKIFPYLFAFDSGEYYDLGVAKSKYRFFYENTVNNRFTNLYCGFDHSQLLTNLCVAFTEAQKNFERSKEFELAAHEKEILQVQLADLQKARSYRLIRKINTLRRR